MRYSGGERGSSANKLVSIHDLIDWGAFVHVTHASRLRCCNYYVCVCVCVCVCTHVCDCVYHKFNFQE